MPPKKKSTSLSTEEKAIIAAQKAASIAKGLATRKANKEAKAAMAAAASQAPVDTANESTAGTRTIRKLTEKGAQAATALSKKQGVRKPLSSVSISSKQSPDKVVNNNHVGAANHPNTNSNHNEAEVEAEAEAEAEADAEVEAEPEAEPDAEEEQDDEDQRRHSQNRSDAEESDEELDAEGYEALVLRNKAKNQELLQKLGFAVQNVSKPDDLSRLPGIGNQSKAPPTEVDYDSEAEEEARIQASRAKEDKEREELKALRQKEDEERLARRLEKKRNAMTSSRSASAKFSDANPVSEKYHDVPTGIPHMPSLPDPRANDLFMSTPQKRPAIGGSGSWEAPGDAVDTYAGENKRRKVQLTFSKSPMRELAQSSREKTPHSLSLMFSDDESDVIARPASKSVRTLKSRSPSPLPSSGGSTATTPSSNSNTAAAGLPEHQMRYWNGHPDKRYRKIIVLVVDHFQNLIADFAFPPSAKTDDMVLDAFSLSFEEAEMDPFPLKSAMLKTVQNTLSSFRGRFKKEARVQILSKYHLDVKDPKRCEAQVNELMSEGNFKFLDHRTSPRFGALDHPCITAVINVYFNNGRKGQGATGMRFMKEYIPMKVGLIALALTAIEAALDEYSSGRYVAASFTAAAYEKLYAMHRNWLTQWSSKRAQAWSAISAKLGIEAASSCNYKDIKSTSWVMRDDD